jgi:hypothetical protein
MPKGESGFGKSGGSSRISGLDVTLNGETTRYYFTKIGSQNYYQRGVDGTPEPTPLNMSAKEFRDRVEKSGASVREVSSAERRSDEDDYKRDRASTNKFLNTADVQDRTMKRGSKANRLASRIAKRKR